MKYKPLVYLLSLTLIIASCNTKERNQELTANYFETIKNSGDNAKLTLFFTLMPKGGDIHHHYSGAIYAETYLDWVSANNLRLDTRTFRLSHSDTCKSAITVDSLRRNPVVYTKLLEAWSDMNYSNNFHLQEPPDQHFFNTFPMFGPIPSINYRAGLAEIKLQAQRENVQYIETMMSPANVQVSFRKGLIDSLAYYQSKQDTQALYQIFNTLILSIKSAPSYEKTVSNYIDSLHSYNQGIDDSTFTMRFQAYAFRNAAPENVFASLYSSFEGVLQDKSNLLAGVNIVGAENSTISSRDYWLHMQMFRYLKNKFPSVPTAMHAGELSLGMVRPQDLSFHIHDAVFIAKAGRIGHGVDIPYETQSLEILNKMKSDSIPIEINLSSNEFILGVKGNEHPIHIYYEAGIPIVISTDDAGVSRNNLSSQYVLLASRYHFSYEQIKTFVLNSIRYSFLKNPEKLALEATLNKRFETFESKMAARFSNRNTNHQ
jgi:adenosine deaminase